MAAFCSCSPGADPISDDQTVIISGTVSDISTNSPLEGVKIVFHAFDSDDLQLAPVAAQNAYTDSKGVFSIVSGGHTSSVMCVIETSHDEYSSVRKEILINWKGTSYDMDRKTFFVNDCDFHLEKIR